MARAADVMLKEGRKLVLCVRDTPFSRIHLENMLRAQQAGAVIMPAIPSFYHHPKTIDDLVTQYVCRVLAQMDLPPGTTCTAGRASRNVKEGGGVSSTSMASRIRTVLEMIKFEHSVFALPFALTGALLAARATHQPPHGWPTLRQILWIVVAMVAARSAAMTMNRIADLRYDRENPRTQQRALATGALSVQFAWVFTVVAVALFFAAAWQIESTGAEACSARARHSCFSIPITKRFTNWSHLFLGFAWEFRPPPRGLPSPAHLDLRMLILCAAVTLWVGGFDVLYACQDVDFDRRAGLFSVPKTLRHRQRAC